MKKALGILLALVLVLAFSVPVMADVPDVTTSAWVVGDASGSPPAVKAKWERFSHYLDSGEVRPDRASYTRDYMTYDDDDTVAGIQVFSPGQTDPQGEIDIEFWAVVTDPQGLADIQFISADVYNPDTTKKYQVGMTQTFKNYWDPNVKANAFALMEAADAAGAITYGASYNLTDIKTQYSKNEAWIFRGMEWLDYCQVYGDYKVTVCAADQGLEKDYLDNWFTYVKEACIEIDFATLDFGEVKVSKPTTISGDEDMGTPLAPTVKNLGNCNANVCVKFDDMGFGFRTEGGELVWNVGYDARLGFFEPVPLPGNPYIDPDTEVVLPGELEICHKLELDFSIHVSKAEPGEYNGICTIWATDPA